MFDKIKNWLGIEGVSIKITEVSVHPTEYKTIIGSLTITSKSEQTIEGINIILKEKYSRGRRKSKLVDEYTIAEKKIVLHQNIEIEEIIDVPFSIKYDLIKSDIDKMGDKNLFYKGLSKLAKLTKNTSSEYFLIAEAIVSGNRLKPFDKISIDLK